MTTYTSGNPASTPPGNTIRLQAMIRFVLLAIVIPMLPMIIAWRFDWPAAWIYVVGTVVFSFGSRLLLYFKDPSLLAERARFTESEGIKQWDKSIALMVAVVGPFAAMIVAGLDKRNSWSAEVVPALQGVAVAGFLVGCIVTSWAMLVNRFFSAVVRLQTDRGQTVVRSGPYSLMRHPGYSGGILLWLSFPVMLGTLWAFVPAGIVVALLVLRTALEDRMLQAELPGYSAYAAQVRYRLLPGVW